MRTLPAALLTALSSDANFIKHLFLLQAASTYYWTDCDQQINFADIGGTTRIWVPYSIRFNPANLSVGTMVDKIQVEIENIDKGMIPIFLNYVTRGSPFYTYRVLLNQDLIPVGSTSLSNTPMVFMGYVDDVEIDRKVARVTILNQFAQWKRLTPRRFYSPSCHWIFKGQHCQFVGSTTTWCDQTYGQCAVLNNTSRFSGFRFAPDLDGRDVYWGKVPKNFNFRNR